MRMILRASLFCLSLLMSSGVCADELKSVCVTEGDSVTLHTDVTEVQRQDQILWMFGPNDTHIAGIYKLDIDIDDSNTVFENRLQMDSQTGSLTITHTTSQHTGLYKLQQIISRRTSYRRFNVSVYAPLPVPVIIRDSSQCSSPSGSSSSSSPSGSSELNCSVVCSVCDVSDVTLSWYKGNSLLSSISVSDLSISLSLPLEVEYQDLNTYSCVLNNPITNRTQHLNITDLCRPCEAVRSGVMTAVCVTLALMMLIAGALLIYHRNCRQTGQKVESDEEEVQYAEPAFFTQRLQSTDTVAEDQTVYSAVRTGI